MSPTRHIRTARPSAFTLLELLVVIAVIAVLIALILPALSGARRSGRALVCETHLRTLGQAMQVYANFYEDVVPLSESPSAAGSMHYAAALLPTVSGETLNSAGPYQVPGAEEQFIVELGRYGDFQCPDFPQSAQNLDFVVNGYTQPYILGDSPGPAGDGPANQPSTVNMRLTFASLTRMKQDTSRIIYLTEGHAKLPTDIVQLHDLFLSSQLPLASFPRIASDLRHPGGINALFFDTHVERMTHRAMDAGYPQPRSVRLRWFTTEP